MNRYRTHQHASARSAAASALLLALSCSSAPTHTLGSPGCGPGAPMACGQATAVHKGSAMPAHTRTLLQAIPRTSLWPADLSPEDSPSNSAASPVAAAGPPAVTAPRPARSSGTAATVSVVTDPSGLISAVESGAEHIEVQAHLNVTEWEEAGASLFSDEIPASLKSITGRCADPPSAGFTAGLEGDPPLYPLLPGQCLIVHLGDVATVKHSLWLDNLYLRLGHRTGAFSLPSALVVHDSKARVWMTDVTIQSDGGDSNGLHIRDGAKAYLKGCTFGSFGGEGAPLYIGDVGNSSGATASLLNCTFRDSADISVTAINTHAATPLRIQNTTFADAADTTLDISDSEVVPVVYADDSTLRIGNMANVEADVIASPLSLDAAPPGTFLTLEDPWLVQTMAEASSSVRSIMIIEPMEKPTVLSMDEESGCVRTDVSLIWAAGVLAGVLTLLSTA